LKQLELKNSTDGTIQAYHPFKRCTQSSSKVTYISCGDSDEQEIAFFEPTCPSFVCCGGEDKEQDDNTIIICGAGQASQLEAKISYAPISIRDFLMDVGELALEEPTETTCMQEEDEEEQAVAALKEVKENIDTAKENIKEFKQQGYQKIMTSGSSWKVSFPAAYSHKQKCAVMLYVIEQYHARL
jgi:hypothetical protein